MLKHKKPDNNKSWLTLIYSYCQNYVNKNSISATPSLIIQNVVTKIYPIHIIFFNEKYNEINVDAILSTIPVTYNTRKEIFYLGR